MRSLPAFLSDALRLCNRLGKPLAVGMLVFGIAIVALQFAFWQRVGDEAAIELQLMVGEERFAEIQEEMETATPDVAFMDQAGQRFFTELEKTMGPFSDEEKMEKLIGIMKRMLERLAPFLALIVTAFLALQLLLQSYFFVLPALRTQTMSDTSAAMLRACLPLAGAWIGMWLCSMVWLPVIIFMIGFVWEPILVAALPSFIPVILLLPRFLFAPTIVVQEKSTIRAALHRSFERTRGQWWPVVRLMVGMQVVVWIVMTFISMFLNFLASSVAAFSIVGFALYWLMPFVGLIALTYKNAFTVLLKEELSESRAEDPLLLGK